LRWRGTDRAAGPRGHRRKFSEADKRRIVEEAVQSGASLSEVARRYGIAARVLAAIGALSLHLNFINLFTLMLRLADVRFARRAQLVGATL
jgi:transposase